MDATFWGPPLNSSHVISTQEEMTYQNRSITLHFGKLSEYFLALILFLAVHLFIAIGLKGGSLYLTSGTARFLPRTWVPVAIVQSCLIAFLQILLRRLLLLSRWQYRNNVPVIMLIALIDVAWNTTDLWPRSECEGLDKICLFITIPFFHSLITTALYLISHQFGPSVLFVFLNRFVQRYVLCDVRLGIIPISYIVVGSPWVWPLQSLGCGVIVTMLNIMRSKS